jgi:general secretion pathway protein L
MNYLIVQLSADEAIFSRFREKGRDLVFIEAFRSAVDDSHPFPSLLQEIKTKGPVEETIILAVPPSLLFMREVEFPLTDRRKVREVLPLEMKGETALDTDDLVFDALALEGGKFLAIWGKQEKIAEDIRIMADQDMEPEVVTASLFHWKTLIPERESTAPVALTDGEALAVYLNGLPVFFRSLDLETFAIEVTRTIAALEITREIRIEKVFLLGEAARLGASPTPDNSPGGIDFIPLQVIGELAATFPADPGAALDLAGAYALAKGCRDKDPINLRRGVLAYTAGFAKVREKLRLTFYLAVALIILLFAEAGLRYYLVTRDLNSLDSSIKSIYRDVFPNRKKPVDEVGELRSEIKRLGGTGSDRSLLQILKNFADVKGDEIPGIYETEIEGGLIRLKGDARSVQGVNDFKTRTASLFSSSEVGEIKSRPDGSVSFTFKGTLKEGGK